MIAAWLLVTLPLGGLIALAAWCAAGTAALRGRATRWAYAGGLVALVALVAATPFRTAPTATDDARPVGLPTPITTAAPTPPPAPTLADRVAALRDAALDGVGRAAALPRPVHIALGAAWLLASFGTATVLVVAWRRMRRATETWPVADVDGTRVRIAPGGAPMVVGLVEPTIVVPTRVVALPPAARAMVLAHERAHVAARDPWLLVLGAAVTVLVPWHPASWWLASRLALAIETDCDARVLAAGAPPRDYGALLIDVASSRVTASFVHPWPALVAGRSSLETRLMTMTARPPRFAGLRAGVLAVASLALAATACSESTLPTAADVATMDAAAATRAARPFLRGDSVTYVVDGRTVSASEANAIAADSIATIEVYKAKKSGAASTVHITTGGASTIRVTTRRVAFTGVPDTVHLSMTDAAVDDPRPGDTTRRSTALVSGRTFVMLKGDSSARLMVPMPGDAAAGRPIVFIDGVRTDWKAMETLTPDRIASVEVVKGEAAVRAYGADAANGAIRITTKPAR